MRSATMTQASASAQSSPSTPSTPSTPSSPPRSTTGRRTPSPNNNSASAVSRYNGGSSSYGGYSNGTVNNYSNYGNGYNSSYGGYGGYGSSYGSNYGSSYGGGYGGYGGYSGGYGGYGGYNSGNGGYGGGYGGYGNRPDMPGGGMFKGFHGIVDVMMRFSHLLDANCQALNMSFMSLAGLFHRFGELKQLFIYGLETVALVKLIQKWRGKSTKVASELSVDAFRDFQFNTSAGSSKTKWLLLVFALVLSLFGPIIMARLLGRRKQPKIEEVKDSDSEDEEDEEEEEENPMTERVVALYSFEGRAQQELCFQQGETIELISKPFPDWWEGRAGGRTGLFPANYVAPVQSNSPPQDA